MVEKKKILKQLVFFVCILIASSSVVNAQTINKCPDWTLQVSHKSKCCPKFYGVPAKDTDIKYCLYKQSDVDSYYSHTDKTYDGVTCPRYGGYCYGNYPKNMISKTYTTTVYFQHSWGGGYKTYICKQAECQWTESYDGCPSGTYFAGWQEVSGNGYTIGTTIQTTSDTSANYSLTVKALCNYNKPPVGDNGTGKTIEPQPIEEPVENVCPKSENKEKITNANNYKFTYNLDGGHFIDGSTERTEIIDSYSVVGAFRLNPLKDGYKFVSWQDENGKDFNFSTKPTKNTTLKAKYEKLTDEEKDAYTCPKDYVLDPSNAKCYKYLKFNREGNTTSKASIDNVMQVPYQTNQSPTAGKAYNYTTVSYEDGSRMCYGYNAPSEGDPGEIIYIKDSKLNTIGKNNATYYFSENCKNVEYEDQEWWKSADTCDFGSYCNLDACTKVSGACDITWSAIIFHSVDATYAKELDTTEIVEDKDTISKGSTGDKSEEEINENPKTGSKLWIFITLGVAFSAAGTYYYRKYRKTEV